MMPPTSGIHAIAAATFEGNPVDPDCGPGGGAGAIGSWSAMIYIHKMTNALSSNVDFANSFSLSHRA